MSAPPSPTDKQATPSGSSPLAQSASPQPESTTAPAQRVPRAPREPYTDEQDLAYRYLRDDLEQPWNTVVQQYEAICLQRGWPIRTRAGLQSRYYRVLHIVLKMSLKEVKARAKKMKKGTRSWGIASTDKEIKLKLKFYSWMGSAMYSGDAGGPIEYADGSAESQRIYDYGDADDSDYDDSDDEDEDEDAGEGPSGWSQRRSTSDSNPPSSPDDDETATEGMADEDMDRLWPSVDGKGKGRAGL